MKKRRGIMAQSYYWYDLETSGTEPRWDRIVQFAGLRTDVDLNEVGDEYCTYVHLPDDVLPDPDASLVTSLTPQLVRQQGISEWQALTRVNEIFSVPGTCVAGYNSLRFDDEFIRHGLYRTLMDPYTREWQNGNSRWDLIDLVRATGALRRDGIHWPADEEGLPVYRLEALAAANGLEHGQAHDAMSDVRATLALARLIKTKQPKLYDYYYAGRFKKQPRQVLEPYGARVCVHVSGMYPRHRFGFAPIVSLCRHPTNSNSIIVADLAEDVEILLEWSEERIRENLFASDADTRPPLKEIRINRCPFVAPLAVLTAENEEWLNVDHRQIEKRMRRLKKPGLVQKIQRVYAHNQPPKAVDVDAALYEGFLNDEDRARCASFQSELKAERWVDLDYRDKRLAPLVARLKARSFTERLDADERREWQTWVRDKLFAEDVPWRTLSVFDSRIEELSMDPTCPKPQIIEELKSHRAALESVYAE